MAEKKRGRPCTYKEKTAKRICELLADGMTLNAVCREEGMPPESTVRLWVLDDREGFAAMYARAREIGYHAMADQVIEIADLEGIDPADKRVRFDARRWLLSKALPKVYGDKITQEVTGANGAPLVPVINLTGRPEPSSSS